MFLVNEQSSQANLTYKRLLDDSSIKEGWAFGRDVGRGGEGKGRERAFYGRKAGAVLEIRREKGTSEAYLTAKRRNCFKIRGKGRSNTKHATVEGGLLVVVFSRG